MCNPVQVAAEIYEALAGLTQSIERLKQKSAKETVPAVLALERDLRSVARSARVVAYLFAADVQDGLRDPATGELFE